MTGFANSAEFNQRYPENVSGNKAKRLHALFRGAFRREADADGYADWAAAYGRRGVAWTKIVAVFVGSEEFKIHAPGWCAPRP